MNRGQLTKRLAAWSRVLGLAFVLCTADVQADAAGEAQSAFAKGDYAQAHRLWEPLARSGNVLAQFGLGQLYFEGLNVKQSFSEAVKWFRRAAEQGFGPAQYNLGNAYKHGRGVAQDDKQAAQWWRQAAEQEIAPAQHNLATLYYFGRGVRQDEQEALRWYRKAAANGHPGAKDFVEQIEQIEQASRENAAEKQSPAGVVTATPQDRDNAKAPAAASESPSPAAPAAERPAVPNQPSQWLMAQSPSLFTVQLTVAGDEQAARDYLAAHRFEYPTDFYGFEEEGEMRYAVICGAFESFATARVALTTLQYSLPRDPQNSDLVIRRFGDLQLVVTNQRP